jgi:hypothetical protein
MTCKDEIEIAGNIAAILTLLGGVGAWIHYQLGFRKKRKELEKRLKEDGAADHKLGKQGAYGFQHLTAKTGLTESEILQASFQNPRIKRVEKMDADGFTEKILFKYNSD